MFSSPIKEAGGNFLLVHFSSFTTPRPSLPHLGVGKSEPHPPSQGSEKCDGGQGLKVFFSCEWVLEIRIIRIFRFDFWFGGGAEGRRV